MGGATLGNVVLDDTREQSEQTTRSEPPGSCPPPIPVLLEFLPWPSSVVDCYLRFVSLYGSFLLHVAVVFYHSNRDPN